MKETRRFLIMGSTRIVFCIWNTDAERASIEVQSFQISIIVYQNKYFYHVHKFFVSLLESSIIAKFHSMTINKLCILQYNIIRKNAAKLVCYCRMQRSVANYSGFSWKVLYLCDYWWSFLSCCVLFYITKSVMKSVH